MLILLCASHSSLNWSDIQWLRSQTKLPIGLKGIQTVEVRRTNCCSSHGYSRNSNFLRLLSLSLSLLQDAKKAYDAGCDAIYLSNHGARALDGYVLSFHLHIACPLL